MPKSKQGQRRRAQNPPATKRRANKWGSVGSLGCACNTDREKEEWYWYRWTQENSFRVVVVEVAPHRKEFSCFPLICQTDSQTVDGAPLTEKFFNFRQKPTHR